MNIPCATIAQVLKPDCEEIEYDYPYIPFFHPGSASYLKFQGEHLLNTRYVNYWYRDNGTYMFYDEHNIIHNKNLPKDEFCWTNDRIDAFIKDKNLKIKRLENVINTDTKILWKCQVDNFEWRASPHNVLHYK